MVFSQPVVDDLIVALEPSGGIVEGLELITQKEDAAIVEFGGQDIAQLVDVATHMAGQRGQDRLARYIVDQAPEDAHAIGAEEVGEDAGDAQSRGIEDLWIRFLARVRSRTT